MNKAEVEFDPLYALPGDWEWRPLDDLIGKPKQDIVDGPFGSNLKASEYTDEGVPIARLQNIDRNLFIHKNIKFIPDEKAEELGRHNFKAGDILISKLGDPLGKACIVPKSIAAGIIVADLVRVRTGPKEIDSRYLMYALNSPFLARQFEKHTKGTTRPRVNLGIVRSLPIPVAPTNQQARIVAEIEKQFSRLDEAVANLKRVKANLKRYKAAVLKAAVEGCLVPTEAELARQAGRPYETAAQLLKVNEQRSSPQPTKRRAGRLWGAGHVPQLTPDELSRLPEGWTWAKVRQVGLDPEDAVQVGPMSMKSDDFIEAGVPVLNVGCVQWGRFNETKLNFLPEKISEDFSRYRIQPGDVLFTRSGTVGRCAVAKPHQRNWLMTFHLLRARPNPNCCLPEYLRAVFEGAAHIRRQTREASIGTTRAGFNTNLLASLDVPLPPMAEQKRIMNEVERRLSVIDELEAAVEANLTRANRLRQSVLATAFSGKLLRER